MTFPYRFIAAAETGEVATSDDGAVWVANGTLPGSGGVVSAWQCGALNPVTGRAIFVGYGILANTLHIAYTDDGDTFTHVAASAPGMNARPVGCVWTDLYNAGRFYVWVRQDGGFDGGVWYSDDDGLTWTQMTYAAGTPTTPNDVHALAIGADRIVTAGFFNSDPVGTMRLYYSTDGTALIEGASATGYNTVGDGCSRSMVYLPDDDKFSFVGASISVFFSVPSLTTVDGTTVTGPTATPFSFNASSGVGVWMPNVSRLVVPSLNPGTAPHQAFIYGPNGVAFSAVAEGPPPSGLSFGMVYNEGRAVGGQTNLFAGGGGFVYTDDGIAFTNVAGPSSKKWRSVITRPALPLVPDVLGLSLIAATAAIVAAGFILGTVATTQTNAFAANTVLAQFPAGGEGASLGTAVSVTIAVPDPRIVPDVIGMTLADAENAIRAAGFLVGTTSVTTEPLGPLGTVVFQTPPGGSAADPGTKVALISTALIAPFDVDDTVISQYSNSPTINRLVENMAEYVDPAVSMTDFYNLIWNVDTAVGFGLDIWGDIVGVSRLLRLPSTDPVFGFINEDDPPDWQTFNSGIFFPGDAASQAYLLPDDSFRTLILTKALSNIVATSAASLNALLRNLFPGRGKSYVVDLGGMSMRFVFEFVLTTTEYAILTQSGALPHPAGVSYSVVVVATETFGFSEAGPTALPFDFGVYYLPPA